MYIRSYVYMKDADVSSDQAWCLKQITFNE